MAHGESRDQRLNQAVELALSQARADWLKNEEELRQREIDQAVEVAITNAVAEAKVEWEKEIMAQVSSLKRRSRVGFEIIIKSLSKNFLKKLKDPRALSVSQECSRVLKKISEHSITTDYEHVKILIASEKVLKKLSSYTHSLETSLLHWFNQSKILFMFSSFS